MTDYSRRKVLTVGAAAGAFAAASAAAAQTRGFGNPDSPAQGRINVTNPIAAQEPGPKNPTLAGQFPSFQDPPATDINGMDLFWASFNNAHKRFQNGGWAREVTQADFAISDAVSGVNMRLGPGGVRELHWHQQAEWAVMTDGKCRVTIIDGDGRPAIRDVKAGDLWYFPPGLPHSLQGLGSGGAEFVLVFDNGLASEFNTLLLTDWMAHTPPEILAQNFGLPESAFKNLPTDNLWMYQAPLPPPLEQVQRETASPLGEFGVPVHLLDGRDETDQGHPWWRGQDRRHKEFSGLEDDLRSPGHGQAGWPARTALASQCRRMAILHQG